MKYLVLSLFIICSGAAFADDFSATEAKLQQAVKSSVRTPEDVARDSDRSPIDTLKFFGLRENMKVVELVAGGGWYTKILAPVLADKGELILALGTDYVAGDLLKKPGFEKVKVTAKNSKMYRPDGERLYRLEIKGADVKNADMVLTFRNYHNFDEAGRMAMNKLAFDALKKGGIYGVVDHTRRHMEEDNPENRRRFDPVLAIKEIEKSGFEFVDYATLHFRADDELRYEVGRRSVAGNTDRFTLKFRKK